MHFQADGVAVRRCRWPYTIINVRVRAARRCCISIGNRLAASSVRVLFFYLISRLDDPFSIHHAENRLTTLFHNTTLVFLSLNTILLGWNVNTESLIHSPCESSLSREYIYRRHSERRQVAFIIYKFCSRQRFPNSRLAIGIDTTTLVFSRSLSESKLIQLHFL